MEDRIKNLEEICKGISVKTEYIKEMFEGVIDVFSQQCQHVGCFGPKSSKENAKKKLRSNTYSSKCYPMHESIHKDVLQEQFQTIVNTLNFANSYALEHLVKHKAISESDNEMIINLGKNRKDQNRYLIYQLRQYGEENFKIFLDTLKEDYGDLAKNLESLFDKKMHDDQHRKRLCVHCMIIRRVSIGDVLDPLFERKLINDSIGKLHVLRKVPTTLLWNQLFHQLKTNKSGENSVNILRLSLQEKHSDISKSLENLDIQTLSSCMCSQQSKCASSNLKAPSYLQSDGSGSISDTSSIESLLPTDLSYIGSQKSTKWITDLNAHERCDSAHLKPTKANENDKKSEKTNISKNDRALLLEKKSNVNDTSQDLTIPTYNRTAGKVSNKKKSNANCLHSKNPPETYVHTPYSYESDMHSVQYHDNKQMIEIEEVKSNISPEYERATNNFDKGAFEKNKNAKDCFSDSVYHSEEQIQSKTWPRMSKGHLKSDKMIVSKQDHTHYKSDSHQVTNSSNENQSKENKDISLSKHGISNKIPRKTYLSITADKYRQSNNKFDCGASVGFDTNQNSKDRNTFACSFLSRTTCMTTPATSITSDPVKGNKASANCTNNTPRFPIKEKHIHENVFESRRQQHRQSAHPDSTQMPSTLYHSKYEDTQIPFNAVQTMPSLRCSNLYFMHEEGLHENGCTHDYQSTEQEARDSFDQCELCFQQQSYYKRDRRSPRYNTK